MKLTRKSIIQGTYHGILDTISVSDDLPAIDLIHSGNEIIHCDVSKIGKTKYDVTTNIPSTVLFHGNFTLLLTQAGTLNILDSIIITINDSEDTVIKDDIALIREELELLKRTFRKFARSK